MISDCLQSKVKKVKILESRSVESSSWQQAAVSKFRENLGCPDFSVCTYLPLPMEYDLKYFLGLAISF